MGLANARHSTISFWFCLRIFFSRYDIEEPPPPSTGRKKGTCYLYAQLAFLWNYNKHFFIFSFFNPGERFVTHTFRSPPTTTTNCRRKWLTADFTGSGSVTLEIHRKIWDLHVNFDSICQGIFESYISITNFSLKWKRRKKKPLKIRAIWQLLQTWKAIKLASSVKIWR
jgi:hypothetical protein